MLVPWIPVAVTCGRVWSGREQNHTAGFAANMLEAGSRCDNTAMHRGTLWVPSVSVPASEPSPLEILPAAFPCGFVRPRAKSASAQIVNTTI